MRPYPVDAIRELTISNDDDAAPTISIADATVNEGNAGTTAATFNVTLSAASAKLITVDYSTADGTAQANGTPSDYVAVTTTTLTLVQDRPPKQLRF